MFAVIKTGGKQYKVAKDDVIRVEKLPGDSGQVVEFAEVLMLGDETGATVGNPLIDGAAVKATVLEQIRLQNVDQVMRHPALVLLMWTRYLRELFAW